MDTIITKQLLEERWISNDMQREGFDREADELIQKLKDTGLMAPCICYVAWLVLAKMSPKAHEQIKMFGTNGDLDNTLTKATELLEALQSGNEERIKKALQKDTDDIESWDKTMGQDND